MNESDDCHIMVSDIVSMACEFAATGDSERLRQIRAIAKAADGPILVEVSDSLAMALREERVRREEVRDALERAWRLGIAAPRRPRSSIPVAGGPHVIISLHGIRTRGRWQKELDAELSAAQLITEPLDYGKYLLLEMARARSRRRKVDWFLREYTRIKDRHRGAKLSIIAHSFGTYMVAKAMTIYPEVRFDRIVFCGAIVEQDYPWAEIIANGQVQDVLNEHGGLDFWARIVSNVVDDAAPSGWDGFRIQHPHVQQRRYPGFRHSDYFNSLHYRDTWIPYLKGEPLGAVPVVYVRTVNRQFRRNKRMLLCVIVAAVVGAALWWWRGR